ncbi:hypothetical protein [Peribacillus butanolivorans]|uniref:hypothetical protein n=1 Tax=Peribacillus butanolivorans TaxID=421767 RepID=UPI003667E023
MAKIFERRYQFLLKLQQWAEPIHSGISRNLEVLKIQYKPSLDVSESMDLTKMIEVYTEKFDKIKNNLAEK